MRNPLPSLLLAAALLPCCGAPEHAASPPAARDSAVAAPPEQAMDFYNLTVNSLEGQPVSLSQYRGKVALVVNVASECGYTPQYAGLEELHQQWRDRGVVVLGFPSNDFGGQEPGTPEQIRAFCSSKYQVDFPLFAKVQTKAGPGQSPVYALLGQSGQLPQWNFGKYVIGKDGRVRAYFPSKVKPESPELRQALEAALH